MDRLTKYDIDCGYYVDEELCSEQIKSNIDGSIGIQGDAIDKLAEYENIEFIPDRQGSKDIWIVGHDTNYYPYIEKFETEEQADKQYNNLKNSVDDEDCVFLAKVKEYTNGKDYEFEYGVLV